MSVSLTALFLFALPAIVAGVLHMVVVRFNGWSVLRKPIDGGLTLGGVRLFGDHKTWRGVFAMVFFSSVTTWLLYQTEGYFRHVGTLLRLCDPSGCVPWWLLGLLYGLGYSLAELPNSFLKRRMHIPEGSRGRWWNILLDQADSVVGVLLMLWPFAQYEAPFVAVAVVVFTLVHLLINWLLYLLGLRKEPL